MYTNSIISEKPSYLFWNLETLTSSNYNRVQYFLLKVCTRFLRNNVSNMVFVFFFVLFRSWVLNVNVKSIVLWMCRNRDFFNSLQITQYLTKIKNLHHHFVVISKKGKSYKILGKSIQLYGSWSSSKAFNVLGKIPGFSKAIECCLKFCIEFCIT